MPSAPTLTITDLQPTSVVLTWTQPSQDIIVQYQLSYSKIIFGAAASPGNRTISRHFRRYILTGLEENNRYRLSIRAVNNLYHSDYSATEITTPHTSKFCQLDS